MFKKQIFGLDISGHSIEALILTKPFFKPPMVVSYARTILRGEVVKNGIIKKPDKLAESIKALLQSGQPKPIKAQYCILSLPESQVFTAVFKLPAGLKYKEIQKTIPYKAEEVIPFKSSEIYFDFKTIAVKGTTQEVFYVAIPSKVVDSYVEVLKSIDLKPIAFDLESVSLARAVIDPAKKADSAKLLMDIGARTTNLDVFDRNGIRQSLTIKIAGDRFTKAVAKSLNINVKEANELKMKNGFDPAKQQGKVLLVLQNEFKRVIGETKKLVDYYQAESQRKISEIILAGGSSLLPKLDQYLADNLGIEVNIGNPLAKIADPQRLVKLKNKAVLFANVAGLALRGLSKDPMGSDVNLLPLRIKRFALMPDREEKRKWRLVYVRSAVLLILAVVLSGLLIFQQKTGQDLYQRIFHPVQYNSISVSDVDVNILEELRQYGLASTTPEGITEAQKMIKIKKTSVGYINVRQGPGVNYSKVGQAESEKEYKLVDQKDDWYQIQLDENIAGWVSASFADLIEPTSENKEEPGNVLDESVELKFKIRIKETSLGYLNLRSGPSTSYNKVGEVLTGQEYLVLAEENGWYQIQLADQTSGWVSSVYVDKLE